LAHKADESFFDEKRLWSKRKDLILSYYLKPYLTKVNRLRRPILLVDGFAGRGRFRDGSMGSPLIMATKAKEAVASGATITQLCIEADPQLFVELQRATGGFTFVECQNRTFLEALPDIERLASRFTVFLYVDPYAVKGLEWAAMDSVFRHLRTSLSSIELLLNFNGEAFARRARSSLAIKPPEPDETDGDETLDGPAKDDETPAGQLDQIVGGDWWRELLRSKATFADEVRLLGTGLCDRLRERFAEVYEHPIKEHWRHKVPKYSLIFASRSPDATRLMNNAIVRSTELWARDTEPVESSLFELRSTEVVPEPGDLPQAVLESASKRMTRGGLIVAFMRQHFGVWKDSDIRGAIEKHLKAGRMVSATGKNRINDDVEVWRTR